MEIPVVHETSRSQVSTSKMNGTTPNSLDGTKMTTNSSGVSSASATTSSFLRLSRTPSGKSQSGYVVRQPQVPPPPPPSKLQRNNFVKNFGSHVPGKIHTVSSLVSSRSPSVVLISGIDGNMSEVNTSSAKDSIAHARLPSTDSGIQADAGFDSLSRYKGKTFLSSTGDILTSMDCITSSSSIDSASHRNSISSTDGNISVAVSRVPPHSTASGNTPFSPVVVDSSPITSLSISTQRKMSSSSLSSTSSQNQHNNSRPARPLQPPPPRPVPQPRSKPPSTSTLATSQAAVIVPVVVAGKSDRVNSQDVTVVSKPGSVHLSFNKNSVTISKSRPSTVSHTLSSLNRDPVLSSTSNFCKEALKGTDLSHNVSTTTVRVEKKNSPPVSSATFPSSGKTAQRLSHGQGQGTIALTRPLKILAPASSTLSARLAQSGTSGQTPLSTSARQIVGGLQSCIRPKPVISRPKPHVSPRHKTVVKPSSPAPPPPVSACTNVSTTKVTSTTFTPSVSSNYPSPYSSQSFNESSVTIHKVKPATLPRRVEIPVRHIDTSSTIFKPPPSLRPKSLPNGDENGAKDSTNTSTTFFTNLTRPSQHQIYENVDLLKAGFSFDDEERRLRHAELVLKQSDELIYDALKMLKDDPRDSSSKTTSTKDPRGERVVEGASDPDVNCEHSLPIYDARTGKVHGGFNFPGHPLFKFDQSSKSRSGDGKDDTWSERKSRIDSALSWLKQELAGLRDMDTTLIAQFRRCQESIESLKGQRELWDGVCEEGEEADFWDDYEINEFNRHYLDSPGGSSSSQLSPLGRDDPSPLGAERDRRGSISQDVEAVL